MGLRGLAAVGLWATAGLALVATETLVYFRVATPASPRAIELVALAPAAIPFALVARIGAIAVLPLTSRRWRRVAWSLATMALVSAAVACSWIAPLFFGHSPPAGSNG